MEIPVLPRAQADLIDLATRPIGVPMRRDPYPNFGSENSSLDVAK
jgi:hypothetical protein